jgi:hypothetical protein
MKHIKENYYLDEQFNLVSLKFGKKRILQPSIGTHGYLTVSLSIKGKVKKKLLHRLIAELFISNPDNKRCVNHINGNKLDNRIENLEWCTYHENITHAINSGLRNNKGQRHYRCKLTESQILLIKADNRNQQVIANEYGVVNTLICRIKKGQIWKHITQIQGNNA